MKEKEGDKRVRGDKVTRKNGAGERRGKKEKVKEEEEEEEEERGGGGGGRRTRSRGRRW